MSSNPERLAYPEPLPPEPRRFAPAPAAFGNAMTARATLAPVAEEPHRPAAAADRAWDGQEDGHEDERDDEQARARPERPVETTRADPEPSVERQPAPLAQNDEDSYDFELLVERLKAGPSHGGRCVLVVETVRHDDDDAERSIAVSLARFLAARAATLSVDVNGRTGGPHELGLSDLVAGEAAFPDVIHAIPGARLHEIRRGLAAVDVLVEEPQGLAIGLNALAQAYDWVVCRIDATEGVLAPALLATVAASMDSVVIASDAPADDAGLLALYGVAEEAGAGQILVAHDRRAEPRREADPEPELRLRLSA